MLARIAVSQTLALAAALLACPVLQQFQAKAAEPYRDLRTRPLHYWGPDAERTNGSEISIAWFGPANLPNGETDPAWWSASLAIQEANERGDCQTPLLKLLPCWSADPWGSGAAQLARMVYQNYPIAVLGSANSVSTHLAEQIVAKANLPLVSFVPTDSSLTLAGVPWMFSCMPTDKAIAISLAGAVLADLASSARSAARWAMVTATDHASRMTSRALLKEFSLNGRLPSIKLDIDPGRTGSAHIVQAGLGDDIQLVLVVAEPLLASEILRALRSVCPEALLYASHSLSSHPAFSEVAADAPEVKIPVLLDPGDLVQWKRFRAAFKRKFHREPDYVAAGAYDAAQLLSRAIVSSEPGRVQVRDFLSRCTPFNGLGGMIHFDGTGQNARAGFRISCLGDLARQTE